MYDPCVNKSINYEMETPQERENRRSSVYQEMLYPKYDLAHSETFDPAEVDDECVEFTDEELRSIQKGFEIRSIP